MNRQARLENLEELVNAAVDYDKQEENGLRDFIDHAALTSDTDKFDRNAARHADDRSFGKGFGVSGRVSRRAGGRDFPAFAIAERSERARRRTRLAYVAITRAEKILYVTHSMRRRFMARRSPPSHRSFSTKCRSS